MCLLAGDYSTKQPAIELLQGGQVCGLYITLTAQSQQRSVLADLAPTVPTSMVQPSTPPPQPRWSVPNQDQKKGTHQRDTQAAGWGGAG